MCAQDINAYLAMYTPQTVEKLIETQKLPREENARQQQQLVPLWGIFCGASVHMDHGQLK